MAIHIVNDNTASGDKAETKQAAGLGIEPSELAQVLKLAGLLQTSLEINSVLEYFLDAVRQSVEFTGAHYTYEPFNIEINYGDGAHHRCSYRLRLSEEAMGELVFFRRKRFSDEEIHKLEALIIQLIYPLRNAIWYQRALRAVHMDPLTGINNRAAMDIALNREIDLAHRHNLPLTLVVLDVDHFKRINDQYGHLAGDYVLRSLVQCVSDTVRGSDMLFRYGGEEFTLILAGTDVDGARLTAERIRQAVENYPFVFNRQEIAVTVSLGIAALTARDNGKDLFSRADQALYAAKAAGRNQVQCYRASGTQKAG